MGITGSLKKTLAYWDKLNKTLKGKILAEALNQSTDLASVASSRGADTTKHDRCRLLHLYVVCPPAQADWSAAYTPINRAQLDFRNSPVDPNHPADPSQDLPLSLMTIGTISHFLNNDTCLFYFIFNFC